MTDIRITKEGICFGQQLLSLGISYDRAAGLLSSLAEGGQKPDETGAGFLRLAGVSFYGLMGTCTVYFQDFRAASISIRADWRHYPPEGLSHSQAVEAVARKSWQGLEQAFGVPIFRTPRGEQVYLAGQWAVCAGISLHGESYSLRIAPAPRANASHMGYALASRQLMERKTGVCFCYRESADHPQDSGWRFFAGTEPADYAENPENILLCDIAAIAQMDSDVIPLLAVPEGLVFERMQPQDLFRVSRLDG